MGPKTSQDPPRSQCLPTAHYAHESGESEEVEGGLSIRQVGTAMRARPHTNGLGDDMGVMIRWHLQETFRAPNIGVALQGISKECFPGCENNG